MCEYYNDGEGPSCHTEQDRRARKQHVCCECGIAIKPGEIYRFDSGIWDGEPNSFKTCALCAETRDEFAKEHHGFLYQGLQEDLEGCVNGFLYDPETAHWQLRLIQLEARAAAAKAVARG